VPGRGIVTETEYRRDTEFITAEDMNAGPQPCRFHCYTDLMISYQVKKSVVRSTGPKGRDSRGNLQYGHKLVPASELVPGAPGKTALGAWMLLDFEDSHGLPNHLSVQDLHHETMLRREPH
jgi:hypothetical protein